MQYVIAFPAVALGAILLVAGFYIVRTGTRLPLNYRATAPWWSPLAVMSRRGVQLRGTALVLMGLMLGVGYPVLVVSLTAFEVLIAVFGISWFAVLILMVWDGVMSS